MPLVHNRFQCAAVHWLRGDTVGTASEHFRWLEPGAQTVARTLKIDIDELVVCIDQGPTSRGVTPFTHSENHRQYLLPRGVSNNFGLCDKSFAFREDAH